MGMKMLDSDKIDGELTQQEIENNFNVLGITGVEDLLQEDVQ